MKQKTSTKAEMLQAWVIAAQIKKKAWMTKFKVDALKKYYEGTHYEGQSDEYYVNMFWSTIEQKLPNMVFTFPRFFISPKPSELKLDAEQTFVTASNLEDAIFDWTSDERNKFADEAEMACLDAFFGFGVLETGYSASFIENPNVSKPEIPGDYNSDKKNQVGKEVEISVEDENIYVKQIPFENFYVSSMNHRYLDRCDWFGYYEFMRVADLKANKKLINTDKLVAGTYASMEMASGIQGFDDEEDARKHGEIAGDYVKVWKIWDNRSKKRFYYCEDAEVILHEKKWKINPIDILHFRFPRKGFYPIPYTYNWIPMQNELNETRESHRVHRRKFKRLYEVVKGTAEKDDVMTLINGPDGGVLEVKTKGNINPVPTAELGASANIAMQVTKEDFNVVAGTTSEWQGQGDRITATQASITNSRAVVRESRERILVGKFLVKVAKKILITMKENFVKKRVVQTARKDDQFGNDIEFKNKFREIDPLSDFGDDKFDFGVTVSVESMSPVQQEEDKNKFIQFISLLKQFPEMSMHPGIIREMAFQVGYKNETTIRYFQQMAQLSMASQIAQGQQNMQGQGNLAQNTVEQNNPPNVEEVRNQLGQQGMPMVQ